MRQITIRVPKGKGKAALALAEAHDALIVSYWPAQGAQEETEMVAMAVENASVSAILNALPDLNPLSVTLDPHEILHFNPPISEASRQLKNLQPRSPVEIFLMGLQSIGSWRNFSIYAITGAVILWVAFYTNSVYLLIAAMLVSPFAGPAMNVALATATGDAYLFRKNLSRYAGAILITTALMALLSLIFNQGFMTDIMLGVGQLSAVAVMLPLAAGVAGAFNLIQSERSSLVSSTAVGMLVTASLAPPAGLLGVALVMQNWDLAVNCGFILLLQLIGINLAGSIIFRLFGLHTEVLRDQRGHKWLFISALVVTVLSLGGLLFWQFSGSIQFQRISEETQITQAVLKTLQDSHLVAPIEVSADFTETEAYGENTLLVTVHVAREEGAERSDERLRVELQQMIVDTIAATNDAAIPFVDIVIFDLLQGEFPEIGSDKEMCYV